MKAYLVLPSMIYGIGTGRLVDLGIQNKFSIQLPQIINASLARGRGGMVGPGTNIWGDVHIEDGVYILRSLCLITY